MDAVLRQPWLRLLFAGITMVVGFTLTAGTLIFLQKVITREDTDQGEAVAFDTPPPPSKPPPKRRPRPKPKPKPRQTSAPPPPSLGSSLAGMSFGLPQFSGDLLEGGTESLVGNAGDTIMPEDALDDPPRPLSRVGAEYPTRARARNIEGYVIFSLVVKADGSPGDIRVLEAEPPGVFEEVAMQALRQWRFEPGIYEGQPVNARIRQPFEFVLE